MDYSLLFAVHYLDKDVVRFCVCLALNFVCVLINGRM